MKEDDVHGKREEDDGGECITLQDEECQTDGAGEGDERQHVRRRHQRAHERPTGRRVEISRGRGKDARDAEEGCDQEQTEQHPQHDTENVHGRE